MSGRPLVLRSFPSVVALCLLAVSASGAAVHQVSYARSLSVSEQEGSSHSRLRKNFLRQASLRAGDEPGNATDANDSASAASGDNSSSSTSAKSASANESASVSSDARATKASDKAVAVNGSAAEKVASIANAIANGTTSIVKESAPVSSSVEAANGSSPVAAPVNESASATNSSAPAAVAPANESSSATNSSAPAEAAAVNESATNGSAAPVNESSSATRGSEPVATPVGSQTPSVKEANGTSPGLDTAPATNQTEGFGHTFTLPNAVDSGENTFGRAALKGPTSQSYTSVYDRMGLKGNPMIWTIAVVYGGLSLLVILLYMVWVDGVAPPLKRPGAKKQQTPELGYYAAQQPL